MAKFVFPGYRFSQNGSDFIALAIRHGDLFPHHRTEVFTEENLDGDQRPFFENHAARFTDAIEEEGATRPQSVIAQIPDGKFEIKPAFNAEMLPRLAGMKAAASRFVYVTMDEDTMIRIIDAQHGLNAVERSTKSADWIWNVVIALNMDNASIQYLHAKINSMGKKEDRSVLKYMDFRNSKSITPHEILMGKIFEALNKDTESILFNRIKITHAQKKLAGEPARLGFNDFLSRTTNISRNKKASAANKTSCSVLSIETISNMTFEEQYDLIQAYYNAWRDANIDIWSDRVAYFLNDLLGVKLMTSLMAPTFRRAIDIMDKRNREARRTGNVKTVSLEEIVVELVNKMVNSVNPNFWLKNAGKRDRWHYSSEDGCRKELLAKLGFRRKSKTVAVQDETEDLELAGV